MMWQSASRWLSASPWMFIANWSAANTSPAVPGPASGPEFISWDAGCGLSGAARFPIGEAIETDRPSRTSRQAAATTSGVR